MQRLVSGGNMNLRWRPLIGLVMIAALAPFAEHPLDWLLAVEIGLSALILVGMFEFMVRFAVHLRLWASLPEDIKPPLALHPFIATLIVISTCLWAIGGTSAVVEAFANHDRALHAPAIFGLLAQPFTLAWLMLFIGALEHEEDDRKRGGRNRRSGDRGEERER